MKDKDHSINAKWGVKLGEIAKWRRAGLGGFIPVLRVFLRLYSKVGLSPTEAMFVLHLMDSKWDSKHPTVKTKILAERMNVSLPQLKRYIRSLEKLGMKAEYNAQKRWYVFDLTGLFEKLEVLANQQQLPPKEESEEEIQF